jgi:F-type H+-transporting ATPase subunit alpha
MQLNPSEISELIKSRIQNFEASTESRNTGTIVSLADGIVRIHGLSDALQGEMLEFPSQDGVETFGLALNLERDSVGAVVLGDYKHLKEGDTVKTTGRILEVPIGPGLLGRVVDALGRPIDGKGPVESVGTSPIEKIAPGVIARRLPTSCASSRKTARWPTPSSSPPRPRKPPRCSSSRRTPAAPWANTSAIAAKTR